MPTLLETQRAMGEAVMAGGLPGPLLVAGGATAGDRLGIYRGTYLATLTKGLRLAFPAVERLVGKEFFEGAAPFFIDATPPASACLDDYGEGFADFLAGFEAAKDLPYLADVARLEWAVNRALHAEDAKPLDLAALAEEQGNLRFQPHPSLSLLHVGYPVDRIWRAVLEDDDAALGVIDLSDGPAHLLVERDASGIGVRRLDESAWRFLADLCRGETLEAAVDSAGVEAGAWLGEHLAAGRLVGFAGVEQPS